MPTPCCSLVEQKPKQTKDRAGLRPWLPGRVRRPPGAVLPVNLRPDVPRAVRSLIGDMLESISGYQVPCLRHPKPYPVKSPPNSSVGRRSQSESVIQKPKTLDATWPLQGFGLGLWEAQLAASFPEGVASLVRYQHVFGSWGWRPWRGRGGERGGGGRLQPPFSTPPPPKRT